MARDRMTDEFDDDLPARRPRRVDPAAARGKVAIPAVFMAIFGAITLFFSAAGLVIAAAAPQAFADAYVDTFKPFVQKQPPSEVRDAQLKQLEDARLAMRADNPANLVGSLLGSGVGLLTLVGGVRMKGLKSWWLALGGSISMVTLICVGCGCTSLPFGIWALVVLLNSDVKAAFAANKGRAVAPLGDDYDGRDERDRGSDL